MEITAFKTSLVDAFRDKASDLINVLDHDQVALVERQLVRYAEFELMLLASKYDDTIDRAQVERDIEHVFASLAALGEVAAAKAKVAIREVVWDVFKAVFKIMLSFLL